MSAPVHTFVSAEETKHTFSISYRTVAGDLEMIALSSRGEPEGYQLVGDALCGRRSDEMGILDMFLRVDGAPGTEIFGVKDEEGNTTKPGIFVTHHMRLELPREDAHILSRQLSYFTYPADQVAESLVSFKPHIDGIAYGDDYIILECNTYCRLKLGLVEGAHRFTFTDYGLQDAPIIGFVYLTFSYLDENGKEWHVKFSAPNDEAGRMYIELRDFLEAHLFE